MEKKVLKQGFQAKNDGLTRRSKEEGGGVSCSVSSQRTNQREGWSQGCLVRSNFGVDSSCCGKEIKQVKS